VDNAIKKFCKNSSLELKERWKAWPIDLSKNEMHEVIGSLLARQVTLATEMVANPPIWNDHIAPVILRCMVDNHINLAWILKDPLERSRRFIYYGLGQVKLQIEHRKAMWKDQSEPGDKTFVENLEAWVNAQQFTFLTEVNVGSWAEMSTREMAEQAGILDFYNHCYIPFSATAHSMWHHVSRFNLTYCSQSLHRFHKVPITPKRPIDPFYATLAAKYMAKSFQAFDKTFNINVTVSNSYEYLLGQFDRIFRQTSKEEEKKSMS
jgi:hypothetical protein